MRVFGIINIIYLFFVILVVKKIVMMKKRIEKSIGFYGFIMVIDEEIGLWFMY